MSTASMASRMPRIMKSTTSSQRNPRYIAMPAAIAQPMTMGICGSAKPHHAAEHGHGKQAERQSAVAKPRLFPLHGFFFSFLHALRKRGRPAKGTSRDRSMHLRVSLPSTVA